jgi:hypothetical protein
MSNGHAEVSFVFIMSPLPFVLSYPQSAEFPAIRQPFILRNPVRIRRYG